MSMRLDEEFLPPLLRGLGFSLVLFASIVVGVSEHREQAREKARAQDFKARTEVERSKALTDTHLDPLLREVRLLRLQVEHDDDLADKVFENSWFQSLGGLGSGCIAMSFFLEALAKWKRREKQSAPPNSAGE